MIIGSIFGVRFIVIDSVNRNVLVQLFLVQLLISSMNGIIISVKWISSQLILLMLVWNVVGVWLVVVLCWVSVLKQVWLLVVSIMVVVVLDIMLVFMNSRLCCFSRLVRLLFGCVNFFIGSDLLVIVVCVMNRFLVVSMWQLVGIMLLVDSIMWLLGISLWIGRFSRCVG